MRAPAGCRTAEKQDRLGKNGIYFTVGHHWGIHRVPDVRMLLNHLVPGLRIDVALFVSHLFHDIRFLLLREIRRLRIR